MSYGKILNLFALCLGFIGAALIWNQGYVYEGIPTWTSQEMADDIKQRNTTRRKFQRIGFLLITLSFVLQAAAQLIE